MIKFELISSDVNLERAHLGSSESAIDNAIEARQMPW